MRHWKKALLIILVIIVAGIVVYIRKHITGKENVNTGESNFYTLFRDGDLIFQTSKTAQSKAIQLATRSKYSHMGLVYVIEGEPFVYEAVQPVKLTGLKEWINRGEDSHYVVKRLKGADKILSPGVVENMKQVGEKYKGHNYDYFFEWSDEKIYCSELVWKIYKQACGIEIGNLQFLRDFDLSSEAVKKVLSDRFGQNIPLDEKVISPAQMFNSDKLITIFEN